MTASLDEVLAEARRRGYLGDSAIDRQVAHAAGFAEVCTAMRSGAAPGPADRPGELLIDLGSGGGIPGLVLATVADAGFLRTVLLEGSTRRAGWLCEAVELLELRARVEVLALRAELAGRSTAWRATAEVVVARSFGPPAVTAELAAPLLAPGGSLVVSEPPDREDSPTAADGATKGTVLGIAADRQPGLRAVTVRRWPGEGVAELGFDPPIEWVAGGFRYVQLLLRGECPVRYPRRTGIPSKRPLF